MKPPVIFRVAPWLNRWGIRGTCTEFPAVVYPTRQIAEEQLAVIARRGGRVKSCS